MCVRRDNHKFHFVVVFHAAEIHSTTLTVAHAGRIVFLCVVQIIPLDVLGIPYLQLYLL